MQYINPIEILGFTNESDIADIDKDAIKKAKRRLIADIDLSDNGHFEYHGIQISKGECESSIEQLTNNDLKDFYFYLMSNKNLNEFLVNGNKRVFNNFQQDSIFKLPDFINFISPYFSPKFDKALLKAFETEDLNQMKQILKTSFLINQSNINNAYKSISNNLQIKISEISNIKTDIKNKKSPYSENEISEVVGLVKNYFPSQLINLLPEYFQSQILKIANEINYLNVVIWENFDNTQVSQDLLEHILTLNIDGLNKPIFEKNYLIVKKRNKEHKEQEKHGPFFKKYAQYLIETKTKIEEVKNKTLTPNFLLYWVNSSISIVELNNLPPYFDELKNQVALSLRAMSVEVWNSTSNIDVSITLIDKANSITGLNPETLQNILAAKKELINLKTKVDMAKLVNQRPLSTPTPISTSRNTPAKSSKKEDNSGCLWLIVVAVVVGIIINAANSKKDSSSDIDYPTSNENYNSTPTSYENNYSNENSYDTTAVITEAYTPPVESKYVGNQLQDGASPLTNCFGDGVYNGNATLTIKNGGNSDAIVCLYSISDDRTIRNEYVRKNSSFTMSSISQGSYKIRVFYGNDWNPELENSCGTKGNFESDVNFTEFDGTEYFEDSSRGYTTATITLYTVAGGNASSSSIDQTQFFKK